MALVEGCCLFCLKTFQNSYHSKNCNGDKDKWLEGVIEGGGGGKRGRVSLKHFFFLLRRHLLEADINLRSKNYILSLREVQSALEPCPDCETVIKSFCDIYNEIKILELKLHWRLGTLVNIVRCSKKVKHRMPAFQMKIKQQLKDSTDDHFDVLRFIKEIGNFRNEIVKKCTLKLRSVHPKVKLRNIDLHQKVQHGSEYDIIRHGHPTAGTGLTLLHNSQSKSICSSPEEILTGLNNADSEPQNLQPVHRDNDTSALSSSQNGDPERVLQVETVALKEVIEAINESRSTQSDLEEVESTECEVNFDNESDHNDDDPDQAKCLDTKENSPERAAIIFSDFEEHCSTPKLELVGNISTDGLNPEVSRIRSGWIKEATGTEMTASGINLNEVNFAASETALMETDSPGSSYLPFEEVVVLNSDVNEPPMNRPSISIKYTLSSSSPDTPEVMDTEANSQLVIIDEDETVTSENICEVSSEAKNTKIQVGEVLGNSEGEFISDNDDNQSSCIYVKLQSPERKCSLIRELLEEAEDVESFERISEEHCSSAIFKLGATVANKRTKLEKGELEGASGIGFRMEDCYSIQEGYPIHSLIQESSEAENISLEKNNLENIMEEIIESVDYSADMSENHEQSRTESGEGEEIEVHEVKLVNVLTGNESIISEQETNEINYGSEDETREEDDLTEYDPTSLTRRRSSRTTHKCSTCSRTFATAVTLKRHQSTCTEASDADEDEECDLEDKTGQDEMIEDDAWQPGNESPAISEEEDWEADNMTRVPRSRRTTKVSKTDIKVQEFDLFSTTYSCDFNTMDFQCPAKFYNPEDLQNHSKLHGKFKCNFCHEVKSHAPDLPVHELTHKNFHSSHGPVAEDDSGNWHFCSHCSFRSNYEPEFIRHHLQRHMNLVSDSFTCLICKHKFFPSNGIQDRLLNHHLTHHQTHPNDQVKRYKCNSEGCGAYFIKNQQLAMHKLEQHTKVSLYMCVDCDLHYLSSGQLERHLGRNHGVKASIPCTLRGCGRIFMTKKVMLHHRKFCRRWTLGPKCSNCSKRFPTSVQLQLHLEAFPQGCELENESKPEQDIKARAYDFLSTTYACAFSTLGFTCKSKFFNPDDLENHRKLHGKFTCNFCPVQKSYAPNMPIHELTHGKFHSSHGPNAKLDSREVFLCPHCSYRTVFKAGYIRHHMKMHMNLVMDQQTCAICKKTLFAKTGSYKALLKHHITHHPPITNYPGNTYKCKNEGCNAYFLQPNQLEQHELQQHAKDSMLKCLDCNLNFAVKNQLTRHLKRNHSAKSYVPCTVNGCCRKFLSKNSMRHHRKICLIAPFTHLRRKRYKCTKCLKTFGTSIAFIRHRRICANNNKKLRKIKKELTNVGDQLHFDDKPDNKRIPRQGPYEGETDPQNANLIEVEEVNFLKRTFTCKYSKLPFKCKAKFYNSVDLENHLKLHGKFKCSFCPVKKSYAPNMPIHELTHKKFHSSHGSIAKEEAKKTFLCPHCSFKTVFKPIYIRHHLKMHMKLVPNQTTCPICMSTSQDANFTLSNHQRTNHQASPTSPKGKYKCEYEGCPAYFLKPIQLAEHNRYHNPAKIRFKCDDCDIPFPRHQFLLIHRKRYHSDDKAKPLIPCTVEGCEKKFVTEKAMINHRIVCLRWKVKKECKAPFDIEKVIGNMNDLRRMEHKGPFPYPCKEANCSEKFLTSEELQKHIKLHGSFSCNFCKEVKTYAPDLSVHELEKHSFKTKDSPVWYGCARCNLAIVRHGKYVNHHLAHLNLPPLSETSCVICKYTFDVSSHMRRAIKLHYEGFHELDGRDPFQCEEEGCSAYFRLPEQLTRHVSQIHYKREMVENALCFLCPDCGRRFKQPYLLRLHRCRLHRSSFMFKCREEGCTQVFETEKAFKNHQNCHKQKFIEMCKVCGKSCKGQAALNLHMVIHTEAGLQRKPRKKREKESFMCANCGKRSKNRHLHEIHMLSHTGPESWPYTCETCGKKCMTMQKLDEHQNTHRKKDKIVFTCEHCGLTYAHRHNFRHHLKSKHGVILPDSRKNRNKKGSQ